MVLLSRNPLGCASLELVTDDVLAGTATEPWLFACHSPDGQRWVAALICAPHSELAISAVRTGRAAPADLFLHSGDGTVEMIGVNGDGVISQAPRLCRELTDDELDSIPRRAVPPMRSRRGGSVPTVRLTAGSSSALPQPA